MKRILIIGNNSYIGNALCQYVNSHKDADCIVDKIGASDGQWIDKDFKGYDTIIHTAAIVHKNDKKLCKDIYFEINYKMTIAVAVKAKNSGVHHFVFLSTMAVYNTKIERITKNTIPQPDTLYGQSKLKAENELKILETEDFKIAIIRPPMVYGDGCKGNYNKLKKMARYLSIFPRFYHVKSIVNITTLCEIIENIVINELSGLYFPQDKVYGCTYRLFSDIRKRNGKKTLTFQFLNLPISGIMRKSETLYKMFSNHYYDFDLPNGRKVDRISYNSIVNEPLVSVIIPSFNSARYIRKAINSVLRQNMPLEIIVINDCSSDNLDEVMEEYSGLNNIIYLKNEINIGVAESRNKGVKNARGKYIAYLDADDWWAPGKLEVQIELMQEKNCILSYTARQLAYDDETISGRIIQAKEQLDYHALLFHNSISCSSVVIVKEVALTFPMDKSELHEDYLTWLRILQKYDKVFGINEPLLLYRISNNGKTRNKIKSAKMTYGVYRELHINRVKALFYTSSHLLNGIKKYFGMEAYY